MFSDLGTEKMTETEEIDQIRKNDSLGFANTDFMTFGKFVSTKIQEKTSDITDLQF